MRKNGVSGLVTCALLCAIGIAIPIFSPFKFVLEPASFTLGSHVAIFIAMFISPQAALAVSLGTALGFFFGGFPIVIAMRAFSHVVFVFAGASLLAKKPDILDSPKKAAIFSFAIALIHALCELIVVAAFYISGGAPGSYYQSGFAASVLLLVGLGTVVHSMVDMSLAMLVWAPVKRLYKQ